MAQCPKCGGNVTFSRESIGSKSKRASVKVGKVRVGGGKSTSNKKTVGLCKNCGYTFTAGKGTGSKLWLWVLGWIFLLPVPLGIILYRNQTMKKNTKIGIFAVACAVYLFVLIVGGNRNNNNAGNTSDRNNPIIEETIKEENTSQDSTIIIQTTAKETAVEESQPETFIEDITEASTETSTVTIIEVDTTISTTAELKYKYIVNSSNGKIHEIDCSWKPDEELCLYFYTLDEVYEAGYSDGCGHCMK